MSYRDGTYRAPYHLVHLGMDIGIVFQGNPLDIFEGIPVQVKFDYSGCIEKITRRVDLRPGVCLVNMDDIKDPEESEIDKLERMNAHREKLRQELEALTKEIDEITLDQTR